MKLLIVDDTKTLPALVQVYLAGWGLEFVQAQDGQAALAAARAHRPALVLTDVRMPGMDGMELCAALRADPDLQSIPVVLMSALHDEAARSRAARVGAAAFLAKPIAVADLRATVARLLGLPP